MLRELHISNLAVISDARIEFDPGLNCFTGATGAGKSLVIGAIELLLGLRSAAEMLRAGVDEGRVSGLFEIRSSEALQQLETLTDVPLVADGGELLLTRRLYASGRTSVSLNGSPITLSMLRQLAEALIDVHGQHEHQFLLKPSNQLDVLDQYASLHDLRQQYHEIYVRLQEARRRLDQLSAEQSLRQQQLELYCFQAEEIDAAELDAAEYDELRTRCSVLGNLEKLKKDADASHSALYEAEGSVLERLKMIAAVLAELSELDESLKPVASGLRDATLQIEEHAFDLGRYLDRLELDPSELAEVTDRLNTINRLLNKYGDSVAAVLQYRLEIEQKIEQLERSGEDAAGLSASLAPLATQLRKMGSRLSDARGKAARRLGPMIEKQLAELGMDKAGVSIELRSAPPDDPHAVGATGFDQVEFLVQTNPGLPAQPLRRIASGGELSRIMLALKGVLAQNDRVSVLVFDEIDANVGGRLGAVIGEKLRALANHHQVLCITHLPQIACYADRHLTVRKTTTGNDTRTSVRRVSGEDRVTELAEMIGGQRITDTARAQARELLQGAGVESRPTSRGRSKSNGRSRVRR